MKRAHNPFPTFFHAKKNRISQCGFLFGRSDRI
jgi:ribosomal protein L37E